METVVEPFIRIGLEPYISIFTLLLLASNGSFVVALLYFVEKIGDPEYEKKVFSKTIWHDKHGNSKKNS